MSAGKGDKPRNCFSKKFKDNYDAIDWGRPKKSKEPTIIQRINKALNDFKATDRKQPRHIYLGCQEFEAVMALGNELPRFTRTRCIEGAKYTIMGMEIIEVEDDSKLEIV